MRRRALRPRRGRGLPARARDAARRDPPPLHPALTPAIRRARPADAAALTRLAHAAKRHWRYPEDWITLWRDALTVTPWSLERTPAACAEDGGTLVGFYALSGGGPVLELEHCWVLPARIGHGIGARLLAHAAATCRAAGATTLRIASDPFAAGFYERMGARPAGTVASTPRGRTLPLLLLNVGGPEMAPHTPQRSSRPGEPGALLDCALRV